MVPETLGDVADIVMGQSPPGDTCNTKGIGLPLLNGPTEYGPHHPTPVQYTTDPKKRARLGDILFCVRGSAGRMNWADREYAIGRGVAAIRHQRSNDFQPFVRAVIEYELPNLLAAATGSTFPNVSASQLSKLTYPAIPESEQRAIAHILGTLDDKIELNRRMSECLDAMAQALFKSWFVDFDPVRVKAKGQDPELPKHFADLFPDSFAESELGEIPEGWEVDTVGEVFNVTMGQSPPGSTYNLNGEGIPFYQGRADFSFRFPARRVFCTAATRFAKYGDTLISVRAPVGDINMASEDCAIGRGVASVQHKTNNRSYTYYSMRSLQNVFKRFEAEGTVFGSIGKKDFLGIHSVIPKQSIVSAFESICSPIDSRIEQCESESQILSTIRDAILPKLIAGEIRISDAGGFLGGID